MIIEKTSPTSPSSPILAAPAPQKWELWTLRSLALMGLMAMGVFLYWFFQPQHIGYRPLYYLLNLALVFKMLVLLHEWYHYVGISVPERPELTRRHTVDMLTTFVPGEPYAMIEETLKAMKAVRYPHETYLCDEGNDPYLIELCKRLGVHHSYRGKEKTNAKAGNINYALRTQATGDIAVILDPDHVPIPEMLDRLLPYFEDEQMGYVQSVQAYKNRNESFIAKGAAEQTYQFYGPMMMSMSGYGSAQAIGANCAFRREAIDSIGGHAPGLAEDMHTAMQLHAKGWKSIYVPEVLTRGLVPATLAGYYSQQLKWSRGVFELLFAALPKLLRGLHWRQILHYLSIPLYFLYGVVTLIDIFVPIAALFLSKAPWQVDVLMFFFLLLPLSILSMLIRQFSQRWVLEEHERGFHFIGGVLRSGTWWVFVTGFVYTLLRIKVPYLPTPKDDELSNAWKLSLPNLIAIGLSLVAIGYGLYVDWNPYNWVMAAFASTNVLILSLVVLMSQQKLIAGFFKWIYGPGFQPIRSFWYDFRHKLLYRGMRKGFVVFGMAALAIFSTGTYLTHQPTTDLSKSVLPTAAMGESFDLPPFSETTNARQIRPVESGWQWMVGGKAFQVKGVSYQTTPLWYTNEFPLTRRQLLRDFQLIQDMGANTIRRYQSDVFDHNVLQVAEEKGLQVMFGFDIPAALDFGGGEAQKLQKEILTSIRQRHQHPSILTWSLGQETWQQQSLHWEGESLQRQRLSPSCR
ncbi:MAG: glycosyltransferase, partial [Bacteroidota bacterium]